MNVADMLSFMFLHLIWINMASRGLYSKILVCSSQQSCAGRIIKGCRTMVSKHHLFFSRLTVSSDETKCQIVVLTSL